MLRILHSSYATERIAAATEFIQSFAAGTEQLIVGASREAADDLVRGIAFARGATFGWHRLSFIQLAARLASPKLAEKGLTPGTSIGNDALAARLSCLRASSPHNPDSRSGCPLASGSVRDNPVYGVLRSHPDSPLSFTVRRGLPP